MILMGGRMGFKVGPSDLHYLLNIFLKTGVRHRLGTALSHGSWHRLMSVVAPGQRQWIQ